MARCFIRVFWLVFSNALTSPIFPAPKSYHFFTLPMFPTIPLLSNLANLANLWSWSMCWSTIHTFLLKVQVLLCAARCSFVLPGDPLQYGLQPGALCGAQGKAVAGRIGTVSTKAGGHIFGTKNSKTFEHTSQKATRFSMITCIHQLTDNPTKALETYPSLKANVRKHKESDEGEPWTQGI